MTTEDSTGQPLDPVAGPNRFARWLLIGIALGLLLLTGICLPALTARSPVYDILDLEVAVGFNDIPLQVACAKLEERVAVTWRQMIPRLPACP